MPKHPIVTRPPDEGTHAFAAKLKQSREALGISMQELARRTGISAATICRYEGGVASPPLDKLLALSEALEMDPEILTGGSGEGEDAVTRAAVRTDRATRRYLWREFIRKAGYAYPRMSDEERIRLNLLFDMLEATSRFKNERGDNK